MEELEKFSALTIHRTKPGAPKVLGSGEAANLNKLISVPNEQLESILRMRWPAIEHERAVVQKELDRKDPIPWKEYHDLIEESQTLWTSTKPREYVYPINKSAAKATEGGGKRQQTPNSVASFSTTPVAISERYAFALRKMSEGGDNQLWFTPLAKKDEVEWENTELVVSAFKTGWAYMEFLFFVDDFMLIVWSPLTGMTSARRGLADILKKFITSETPPKINAVRVSKTFVVISVHTHGTLVMVNNPKLPVYGFIPGNVSISVCGDYDRVTVGLWTGVVEYWIPDDNAPPGDKKLAFRKLGEEMFFTDDVTTSRRNIKMKPEPIWNLHSQGPRVALTTQSYFVMVDKNPATSRLCKLQDTGTLSFFTIFGDLVAVVEPDGIFMMAEFASGQVFYRCDEGMRHTKGAKLSIGHQSISFIYDRAHVLLANGDLLMFSVKRE